MTRGTTVTQRIVVSKTHVYKCHAQSAVFAIIDGPLYKLNISDVHISTMTIIKYLVKNDPEYNNDEN